MSEVHYTVHRTRLRYGFRLRLRFAWAKVKLVWRVLRIARFNVYTARALYRMQRETQREIQRKLERFVFFGQDA